MFLYGVHNKKLNVYEDFLLYDDGNQLIDDLVYLVEDFEKAKERKRPFALPNYLVHPDEYDLYKICCVNPCDFLDPVNPCHSYKGSIDEVLKHNYMDREDVLPE